MSKSIRIKTTPGGDDKFIRVNLEQDFDFLEILSLKLTQEEVYRQFYSDYGVVVGRVFCNGGLGLPNAKVSIFVPMDPNERFEIKELYPYRTVVSSDDKGIRYNLLPKDNQNQCHVPVGTFPSKREILDNDLGLEVFDKYYKYTTTTNDAGDFMIFGVPVGNHMVNVDVDLSDIGMFSQKPYDMMEQGNPDGLFKSPTQFKGGKNINNLTQIKTQQIGVNVLPFWGQNQKDEVGISRVDVDLNYEIKPKAIFMGSLFSDTEKNSLNKNCETRKKAGKICEMTPVDGTIRMIRKRMDGEIEEFSVGNGDPIDEDGVWAFQVPMNLDYMVTDEYGKLIPTEEPNKGIPTRTRVRFKIEPIISGDEGRLRSRASYLIPHNPQNNNELDYEFGEETKETSFRDLYWNKIYSVKNFIPRYQGNKREQSRRFTGLKDVDDCTGNKNPLPFNRMDRDLNPLYTAICFIITIVLWVITMVNDILTYQITIPVIRKKIRPFCGMAKCIPFKCDEKVFYPGCEAVNGDCNNEITASTEEREKCYDGKCKALDCYQYILAEALNVYEFDFYNDWLNGSLYNVLFKYKHKRNGGKFCDVDDSNSNHLHDTMVGDDFYNGHRRVNLNEGIIKEFKGDLYYPPVTKDGKYKLLATDIINLGTVNRWDWQGQPSVHDYLLPTTYQIPPITVGDDDKTTTVMDYGDGTKGLLFNLKSTKVTIDEDQTKNIKRICELGVGLDEDRSDEPGGKSPNGRLEDNDIENQFARDAFILLNNPAITKLPDTGLKSGFESKDYIDFRNYSGYSIPQPQNSFYFYFGINPNKTALDKMNKRYFRPCILDTNTAYDEDVT